MDADAFEYREAETIADAIALLEEHPDAEVLAGGHTLLPNMEIGLIGPDTVVDIGGIDAMQGIDRDGDVMNIGALTTYSKIIDTDELWDGATVLTEAIREIGDTQIRNRATGSGETSSVRNRHRTSRPQSSLATQRSSQRVAAASAGSTPTSSFSRSVRQPSKRTNCSLESKFHSWAGPPAVPTAKPKARLRGTHCWVLRPVCRSTTGWCRRPAWLPTG